MVYFSYEPLFDYLYEKGISHDSLVTASVVASGVFSRMKHHKNIETTTICRIMDYLQINDISLIMKVVETKDSSKAEAPKKMRYNYCGSKYKK